MVNTGRVTEVYAGLLTTAVLFPGAGGGRLSGVQWKEDAT